MADNNQLKFMTPDVNKKRTIDSIVSPSDGPQSGHVNSPIPLRRKEYSSPDVHHLDGNMQLEGKTFNIAELVKSAVCSSDVMKAVADAIVPSLTTVFQTMLAPINDKLDAQSKGLETLNSKIDNHKTVINKLTESNKRLQVEINEADDRIDSLEDRLDDMEQYGRRNSLRFHRVSINSPNAHCSPTDPMQHIRK